MSKGCGSPGLREASILIFVIAESNSEWLDIRMVACADAAAAAILVWGLREGSKFAAVLGKLNAVPPEYATVIGLPLSFTVKIIESVPGVWPGVAMMVTPASPSVILWPSSATMSRFGFPPG